MEVNIKEQDARLKAELAELQGQLNQVNQQVTIFQQQASNLTALVLKKMGALELLQGFEKDGAKPKEEEDKKEVS